MMSHPKNEDRPGAFNQYTQRFPGLGIQVELLKKHLIAVEMHPCRMNVQEALS